jgi:hypothetical protein
LRNESKPTLIEIIRANRKYIIALLAVPILGMIIASGLILYKRPDNMRIVLAVIFFLVIQYAILIVFFNNRLNKIVKKAE